MWTSFLSVFSLWITWLCEEKPNIYHHLAVKTYTFVSLCASSNHHCGSGQRQEEPWWLCRGLGLSSWRFCFPWCVSVWCMGGYWRCQEWQNLNIYCLDKREKALCSLVDTTRKKESIEVSILPSQSMHSFFNHSI